ncbi:MAG: sulfotransferase family protein [Holophagales bacterium]|nr:sulfotransferase family protein [Holophagales bacterium]
MTKVDPHDVARRSGRVLEALAPCLLPRSGNGKMRAGASIRRRALDRRYGRLAATLAASATPEHREVAEALRAAAGEGDHRAALALVRTAGRRPDTRAEKIVSRRYRYLWICNPKAASRSLIAALRAADPGAELIRRRTLDEVLERRPEARGYFRFAFLRHPAARALSAWADKHTLARTERNAYRWFIRPWYGLRTGMSFEEFCRWLGTPFGADAFADRHWLSQHRQIRDAGGRLPDFLGRVERIEADWRAVCERLEMPCRALPRLNPRPAALADAAPDPDSEALLRWRYAEDYRLGGYDDGQG